MGAGFRLCLGSSQGAYEWTIRASDNHPHNYNKTNKHTATSNNIQKETKRQEDSWMCWDLALSSDYAGFESREGERQGGVFSQGLGQSRTCWGRLGRAPFPPCYAWIDCQEGWAATCTEQRGGEPSHVAAGVWWEAFRKTTVFLKNILGIHMKTFKKLLSFGSVITLVGIYP